MDSVFRECPLVEVSRRSWLDRTPIRESLDTMVHIVPISLSVKVIEAVSGVTMDLLPIAATLSIAASGVTSGFTDGVMVGVEVLAGAIVDTATSTEHVAGMQTNRLPVVG